MDEGTAVTSAQDAVGDAFSVAERPAVTFMGNTIDLAALGALASAVLLAFMCGTCNIGFYCLPFLPLALGLVGLLSAPRSLDAERTRLWSWIGIGVGGALLLLMILGIIAYFLLLLMAFTSSKMQ